MADGPLRCIHAPRAQLVTNVTNGNPLGEKSRDYTGVGNTESCREHDRGAKHIHVQHQSAVAPSSLLEAGAGPDAAARGCAL
jgi:hypothetical protein